MSETQAKPKEPSFTVITTHSMKGQLCHERFDDVVAAAAPPEIFVDDTLIVDRLQKVLHGITAQCAKQVQEHLHHAEFYVTKDRDLIFEVADNHCDECIAGNKRAAEYLDQHPGSHMIVGRLWWVIDHDCEDVQE